MLSDIKKIFSRGKAAEQTALTPKLDAAAFERVRARERTVRGNALEKALGDLDELFSPEAREDIIQGLGARWGAAGSHSEKYVRLTAEYDAILSQAASYRSLMDKKKRNGKEEAQLSGYLERIESAVTQVKFLRAELVPDAPSPVLDLSMSAQEAYRVFGLSYGASWNDVKQAFRPIARRYHPDTRVGKEDPKAEEIWTEALSAYKTLEHLLR